MGTTAYSYDGLSRLTAETTTRGTGTLTLACNQTIASQIIALATEGGTSNLTYDRDGRRDMEGAALDAGSVAVAVSIAPRVAMNSIPVPVLSPYSVLNYEL